MAYHSRCDTYVGDMAILPQEKKASYTHALAILITKKADYYKKAPPATYLQKTHMPWGVGIQKT